MLRDFFNDVLREITLDCVIFGFSDARLKVLLLRWKNTDKWSLPGGRIKTKEDIADAANRVLAERIGLKNVFLRQFNTFGKTDRYVHYSEEETISFLEQATGESLSNVDVSRRAISIGYYALVNISKVVPKTDPFSDECRWWDVDHVPKLLFDHNLMLEAAISTMRKEINYQPVGNLLPEKFTLNEIHKLFESILDTKLDRRNFHKLITSYDFLIRLNEKRKGTPNKAPYLYRFDSKKYYKALKEGVSI